MPIGVNNATGDFMDMTGISQAAQEITHHEYDPEATYTDPNASPRWVENTADDEDPDPSFLKVALDNFLDTITNTGIADALQVMWGGLAHTSSFSDFLQPKKATKADIDYVKNALPDDEDAQQYVLAHGRDSEEIQWLVNQKLVDKKRREEIAQWRAGNQSIVEHAIVGVAGFAGSFADPLMYIPIGTAARGLKMADRLGDGLLNLSKAKEVARYAAEVGTANTAVVMADDVLRQQAGGEKPNYGFDAAVALLTGTALGATGGMVKALRRGGETLDHTNKLDALETKAYEDTAGMPEAREAQRLAKGEKAHNETYDNVAAYHQADFADVAKSKLYDKLVESKRLIAAPSATIRQLIRDTSGIEIPENAKAIYVPNEDYAILLTDKLKPHEVEPVLLHEFGVHAGLEKAMGEKAYARLLKMVDKEASKEGTVFNEARKLADTYDPEEVLAKVVEDGKLGDSTWKEIKNAFNKHLKGESSITLSLKQVKDIVTEQAKAVRNPEAYHVNPDGSTAFAGLRFSKDNILNPENLGRFIQLEERVTQDTQRDLFTHLPDILANPLRKVTKWVEQGIFGQGINSVSNTLRRVTPQIWQDARGRGLGYVPTITAEENKHRIMNILIHDYEAYANTRLEWCKKNRHIGLAGQMMFDKMVTNAYNAKYAFNTSNVMKDLPEEVTKAVEQMHALREDTIMLGKRSATDVASTSDNLIDPKWYSVDDEMHRRIDTDQLSKLAAHFNTKDDMVDFLEKYIRDAITPEKFEVIREKLKRPIAIENAHRKEYNAHRPINKKDKPLLDETVTDEEVKDFIDQHARQTAEGWCTGAFDPADPANLSSIGNLDFLRARMPLDTTHIAKLPDGTDFSFDNNLRDYDLDKITLKNISRFAGEASLKNVFNSQRDLETFFKEVGEELDLAHKHHQINGRTRSKEYNDLTHAIAEFRGTRSPDEIGIGRAGAVMKILRNLAYVKNGANMGINQIGEAGGTIAYGGASQLFHIFPPLGRFIEQVKLGKVSQQTLRDADDYIFGSPLETQIWNMNWGDRTIRDALTTNNLIDRGITFIGDMSANLGKVTSTVNFLPKMTDAMVRGMRVQAMVDSIRSAYGQQVGNALRKPFSEAKLKASHITPEDAEAIKQKLKEYTKMDNKGNLTEFNFQDWQKDDPYTFIKWYGLIQNQAERAIVSSVKQGNKNLLKNSSQITQMIFQFKDYNLRAINAQTLRAMTAADIDDALATGLSVALNTATYAGRVGLTIGALKAAGADKKAKEYYDSMMDNDTLVRAAATRSTMIGSPLSFGNDLYEALAGAPSVRTTVQRRSARPKERTASDIAGDFFAQLPAIREASNYTLDVYRAFDHASDDKFTKRDFSKMLRLLPVPNMIPFYALTNSLVENSDFRR